MTTVLSPGGRFVLGDVVVPEDPSDVVTPNDAHYDRPGTVTDLLRSLAAAGLQPHITWAYRDLAVLVGQARQLVRPPHE